MTTLTQRQVEEARGLVKYMLKGGGETVLDTAQKLLLARYADSLTPPPPEEVARYSETVRVAVTGAVSPDSTFDALGALARLRDWAARAQGLEARLCEWGQENTALLLRVRAAESERDAAKGGETKPATVLDGCDFIAQRRKVDAEDARKYREACERAKTYAPSSPLHVHIAYVLGLTLDTPPSRPGGGEPKCSFCKDDPDAQCPECCTPGGSVADAIQRGKSAATPEGQGLCMGEACAKDAPTVGAHLLECPASRSVVAPTPTPEAIAAVPIPATSEEARAEMKSAGVDPDAFIAEARAHVENVRVALGQPAPAAPDVEQETDGRWLAESTSVNGAMAYGSTPAEAVAKVRQVEQDAVPGVVWEGDGVRVLADGTCERLWEDGSGWEVNASRTVAALARALAEAKREQRKAVEAMRARLAEAVREHFAKSPEGTVGKAVEQEVLAVLLAVSVEGK